MLDTRRSKSERVGHLRFVNRPNGLIARAVERCRPVVHVEVRWSVSGYAHAARPRGDHTGGVGLDVDTLADTEIVISDYGMSLRLRHGTEECLRGGDGLRRRRQSECSRAPGLVRSEGTRAAREGLLCQEEDQAGSWLRVGHRTKSSHASPCPHGASDAQAPLIVQGDGAAGASLALIAARERTSGHGPDEDSVVVVTREQRTEAGRALTRCWRRRARRSREERQRTESHVISAP
jgi:hypothetical protein